MTVAKIIELSAESTSSFDDAVKNGLEKAQSTVKNVRSLWIKDQEAIVENNRIVAFRVHMKATFALE